MKKLYRLDGKTFAPIAMMIIFACGANAYSRMGGTSSGGGDLCEDRIKNIRDDIQSWIQSGGPSGLNLPQELSVQQYSSEMLAAINTAKIQCVGPGDSGFPVNINGTAKVCRFDQATEGGFFKQAQPARITCDYEKLQEMEASDQYVLVHHEYAGIAGVEVPNGDDSDYRVSNQISGFLEDQTIKKLVIRPTGPIPSIDESKLDINHIPLQSQIVLQAGLNFPANDWETQIYSGPHVDPSDDGEVNCWFLHDVSAADRVLAPKTTLTLLGFQGDGYNGVYSLAFATGSGYRVNLCCTATYGAKFMGYGAPSIAELRMALKTIHGDLNLASPVSIK